MIFKAGKYTFDTSLRTFVMGIINVTPDSFSDGGRYFKPENAVEAALKMRSQGADIIDIGAFSTRPGHVEISPREETERLAPVLYALKGRLDVPVSVDTFNPETAEFALSVCADIINDVSGAVSPLLAQVIKKHNAGWIIMHTGGGNADCIPGYTDIICDVGKFFRSAAEKCDEYGIDREYICFDCGFGFGKNHSDNYTLLANLEGIDCCSRPLMAALSKKRMLGEISGREAVLRTEETVAADTAAILSGADFIRVHDVPGSVYAAAVADEIKKYRKR